MDQNTPQPIELFNVRVRDLEASMSSVSEKLISIEGQLKAMAQEMENSDSKMSGVNLDIKAAVTTIQNAMVSFGALKERVSMLSETIGEVRELRNSIVEEVSSMQIERMGNCKQYSELRFNNLEKQVQEAVSTSNGLLSKVQTEIKSALEAYEKAIDTKLSYIHNGAYIVVGALALTLIKMIAAKLGLTL